MDLNIKERLDGFFRRRKLAYIKVFNKENVYTEEVLEDLAKFCRANDSAFHPDSRVHAVLEGRREVFLRIQSHINLTTDQLYKLYGKGD